MLGAARERSGAVHWAPREGGVGCALILTTSELECCDKQHVGGEAQRGSFSPSVALLSPPSPAADGAITRRR
jgi:hypothetical protein